MVSLGVAPPESGHVSRDGVSGVESDPLSGVVSQHTEHGPELGDIALEGYRGRGERAVYSS